MIKHTVFRPEMDKDSRCYVSVNGARLSPYFTSLKTVVDMARKQAIDFAREKDGVLKFTNQVGNSLFEHSFYLVTWDDEHNLKESTKKHKLSLKERQVMPLLIALVSFVGAYQIGRVAESARDWFLFTVTIISFVYASINGLEERK